MIVCWSIGWAIRASLVVTTRDNGDAEVFLDQDQRIRLVDALTRARCQSLTVLNHRQSETYFLLPLPRPHADGRDMTEMAMSDSNAKSGVSIQIRHVSKVFGSDTDKPFRALKPLDERGCGSGVPEWARAGAIPQREGACPLLTP